MDGHDWEIADERLDILDKAPFEIRPIAALQSDLVVMDQANALMKFFHDAAFVLEEKRGSL